MVLVAFLGSKLGCQSRKLLHHNQMPIWVGEGKIRQRAGTTPPPAAARCESRWSFPPFGCRERAKRESRSDQFDISN
jgi:hypothetical protein